MFEASPSVQAVIVENEVCLEYHVATSTRRIEGAFRDALGVKYIFSLR